MPLYNDCNVDAFSHMSVPTWFQTADNTWALMLKETSFDWYDCICQLTVRKYTMFWVAAGVHVDAIYCGGIEEILCRCWPLEAIARSDVNHGVLVYSAHGRVLVHDIHLEQAVRHAAPLFALWSVLVDAVDKPGALVHGYCPHHAFTSADLLQW